MTYDLKSNFVVVSAFRQTKLKPIFQMGSSNLNTEFSGCDPTGFLKEADSCAKTKRGSEPGVTERRH